MPASKRKYLTAMQRCLVVPVMEIRDKSAPKLFPGMEESIPFQSRFHRWESVYLSI